MGIIPACAGNTPSRGWRNGQRRDHPRVCGEHLHVSGTTSKLPGSSPRVRGTRSKSRRRTATRGIIPACAGNTCLPRSSPSSIRDHPRVCGEHLINELFAGKDVGSSPRVRGTLLESSWTVRLVGIIPACAGNTWPEASSSTGFRDHPRVCGEHVRPTPEAPSLVGSSPRVRGTLQRFEPHGFCRGIIPACAGNTYVRHDGPRFRGDHPRVCGEHPSEIVRTPWGTGSSPRVRGTLVPESSWTVRFGIIPACAGNTYTPFDLPF